MPSKKKLKGISTLISAILVHSLLGNIYTWSNLNAYYCSYLRLFDPSITLLDGYFMVPTAIFFEYLLILPSGYIDNLLGPRMCIFLALLLAWTCHIVLYFYTNFLVVMTAMIGFGSAIGWGYYPILRCVWKYFPEKKGWITGVVLACFGMSSFIFTSIADYIINPFGEKSYEGFFPKYIAERVPNFILVLIICFAAIGTLTWFLIFPYTEEPQVNENTANINVTMTTLSVDSSESIQEEKWSIALKSRDFAIMCMMAVGTLFFGYLATNTSRSYGSINHLNEILLQTLSKVYALTNGFSRIIWGLIYDRFGFFYPYLFVVVNQLITSSSYYFSGKNDYAFFVVNTFSALSFSGHATIFPPLVSKVFNIHNSIHILGIIGIFIGISGFLGPVLAKLVIKKLSDYLIVYMIGTGFTWVSWILMMFVKHQKFDYGQSKWSKDKVSIKV